MMQNLLFGAVHAKSVMLSSSNSFIADVRNKSLYSYPSQNSFEKLLGNPINSTKETVREKKSMNVVGKDDTDSNDVQNNVTDRHAKEHTNKYDGDSVRTNNDSNAKISERKADKNDTYARVVVQKKRVDNTDRMDMELMKEISDIADNEQKVVPAHGQYGLQDIVVSMNSTNVKDDKKPLGTVEIVSSKKEFGVSKNIDEIISSKKELDVSKDAAIKQKIVNKHSPVPADELENGERMIMRGQHQGRDTASDKNATSKRGDELKELFVDKFISQKYQEENKKRTPRNTVVASRRSPEITPISNSSVVSEAHVSSDRSSVINLFGIHTNGNVTDFSEGIWTQKITHQLQQTGNQDIIQQAKLVLQNNNNGEIRIQLNPKEFGDVKLIFYLEDNLVNAKAVVSSEVARNAMQKNFDSLAQQFSHEGYDIGNFSVSVDSNSSENQNKEDSRAFKSNTGIDLMHIDVEQQLVHNYVKVSDTVDFVA